MFFVLAGLLMGCAFLLRPMPPRQPNTYPPAELAAIKALRDTSIDARHLPTVQRDVDYSQRGAWFPSQESPLLAELVAEGKLPPVAERVGEEPLILEGPEGVGNYGGTWVRAASSATDVSVITWRLSCTGLVRWSPLGDPIRPNVAKAWTVSPDQREWTFYLRKGMKWSDGVPFTADDILYFWQEDKVLNAFRPEWMLVNGQSGDIVKVDDYTVKFVFPAPNGLLLEKLAVSPCFSPKHYFAQYLPGSGNPELIQAAMQARGLASPLALYNGLRSFKNPEQPQLWPWVYRTYKSSPPEEFVRNPYFWAVDPQGHQLPYVDRLLFEVRSPKLIPIAASSGEITMQERNLAFSDYTMLMANRGKNHYQVYHWLDARRSTWTLWPNLNRHVLPGDLESRWKARLLNEKTFRQAMSLAINRREIIDALYNGVGEPSQIEPGPESNFHSEKLAHSFTAFDPARANRMLDALGLTRRDAEGLREFPDGTRMSWFIDYTDYSGEGPAQFIVDDWAGVGVRAIQRERSRSLFIAEKAAMLHDFTVWSGESEFNPVVEPRSFAPVEGESFFAPAYGMWYQKGGMFGNPQAAFGGLAPPVGSPSREAQNLVHEVQHTASLEERQSLFAKVFDIDAEQVWSISVSTPPPALVVVKDGFHNVPRNAHRRLRPTIPPLPAGSKRSFFDQPGDSLRRRGADQDGDDDRHARRRTR